MKRRQVHGRNVIQTCRATFLILTASVFFVSVAQSQLAKDIMLLGEKINAPTPFPEIYNNDLIHPCVRYIPEGFAGHKWWMVATPYWGFNYKIENPILYHGVIDDSTDENEKPPLSWNPVAIIESTPSYGHNSDPSLYFVSDTLWIFWRECFTPSCLSDSLTLGTYGKFTTDGNTFSEKKLFAREYSNTEDSELCPIVFSVNGQLNLYGCHHRFFPSRRPIGMTIWGIKDNDLMNNQFERSQDVTPTYKRRFDFWHFDLFEHEKRMYCVVTPECADEILLGYSLDGVQFKFWDTPLLSTQNTGRSYFYKPTAVVLNNEFYLIYPCAEFCVTPQTNRLWMSHMNFTEMVDKLNKNMALTLEGVSDEKIAISSENMTLILNNTGGSAKVRVYSTNGTVVYDRVIQHGTTQLLLDRGIYIVATETSRRKIAL